MSTFQFVINVFNSMMLMCFSAWLWLFQLIFFYFLLVFSLRCFQAFDTMFLFLSFHIWHLNIQFFFLLFFKYFYFYQIFNLECFHCFPFKCCCLSIVHVWTLIVIDRFLNFAIFKFECNNSCIHELSHMWLVLDRFFFLKERTNG
jgi:hypothetical protein